MDISHNTITVLGKCCGKEVTVYCDGMLWICTECRTGGYTKKAQAYMAEINKTETDEQLRLLEERRIRR